MLWQHRSLVAVIVFAFTLLGVASGVRIAQIEREMKWQELAEAERQQEEGAERPERPLATDPAFYSPHPAYKPASKPTPKPALDEAVESRDGISAESYIVGDIKTGQIFLSRSPDRVLPFASMSKLITALIATSVYSSSTPISITEEEAEVPDITTLHAGERFTVKELLYPLLMNSSNIAGEALASSSDRASFLRRMSDYAWEVGMPQSILADPTGLSPNNSGTARGFFGLAQYLMRERSDLFAITRIPKRAFATTTAHDAHEIVNIHPFVGDPRFLGGKTGHTNTAKDTMLTILKIEGRPIAFIVLRSDDRASDTKLLVSKLLDSLN